MSINLTEEQRQAVMKGEPVRLLAPEVGGAVVVLQGEQYERIRALLEDEREKAAWAKLARKAADRWAQENPF